MAAIITAQMVANEATPCGDDAALLVSELFASSIRHGGSGAEGRRSRSRSGPPAAWSGSRSPTAAAGGAVAAGLWW